MNLRFKNSSRVRVSLSPLFAVACLLPVGVDSLSLPPLRSQEKAADTAKQETNGKREPFTETIPGTVVKFEMVPIPAGSVTLKEAGPEKKTQTVQVKPLWVGKVEVTWDMYDVFQLRLDLTDDERAQNTDAKSRPSKPYGVPDHGWGHRGYAALHIAFQGAENFCKWLSAKTGKKYRLPTEAEWEYACRAGGSVPETLSATDLAKAAWFEDNADDQSHPVGKKAANPWGLHDMLGNVSEWCIGVDGKPITCGGNYLSKAKETQPSSRLAYTPDWQAADAHTPKSKWWLSDGPFVGFRLVCEK